MKKMTLVALASLMLSSTTFAKVTDSEGKIKFDPKLKKELSILGGGHIEGVAQFNGKDMGYGDTEVVVVDFSQVKNSDFIGGRLTFTGEDAARGRSLMSLVGQDVWLNVGTNFLRVSPISK